MERFGVSMKCLRTVDGSEIPRPTTVWMYKTLVNNGINYQPQQVSRISEPSTVGSDERSYPQVSISTNLESYKNDENSAQ